MRDPANAGDSHGARVMQCLDQLAQFPSEADAPTQLHLTPEHEAAAAKVADWMREQGPVLDDEGLPVGIISATSSTSRFTMEVDGMAGCASRVCATS